MSARAKSPSPGQWDAVFSAFQHSLRSLSPVFKELTWLFGRIWFPLSAVAFFSVRYTLPGFSMNLVNMSLSAVEACFTIFIVPWLTYRLIQKGKGLEAETFKVFLAETITPLILNSLKAVCIILGYTLLLIIPGVIKALKLMLLPYTVFFDRGPMQPGQKSSMIKATQETSKGCLTVLFFVFVLGFPLAELLAGGAFALFFSVLPKENPFFGGLTDTCVYLFDFYFRSFKYVVLTHFFFILKEREGALHRQTPTDTAPVSGGSAEEANPEPS